MALAVVRDLRDRRMPGRAGGVPHLQDDTWRDSAGGGCTVITTSPDGELIWETVALAGTSTNCTGGVTPWDTWLTCEENEDDGHGYVFEVDPRTRPDRPAGDGETVEAPDNIVAAPPVG